MKRQGVGLWGALLGLVFLALAAVPGPSEAQTGPAAGEARPEAGQEEPNLGPAPELKDYLTYAALANTGLKAAFLRWKAALEKIPQVKALPDPRFTYAFYIRRVETRVGPQRHSFALAQTFPWFGTLKLRGDAASSAAEAERARYEAAKLALFYEVKKAFYEYSYLARAVEISRENLGLLKYLEKVAEIRYSSGTATHHDLVRAQVERARLEDRLATQLDLRQPVAARLNSALGRPAGEPLPWPQDPPEIKLGVAEEEILARLQEDNPDLLVLDHLASREESNLELARKRRLPDLTLGLQYIETGPAVMPLAEDNGKDPVIASLSLTLPLWAGSYRAQEQEAVIRGKAFRNQREDLRHRLLASAKLALYNYKDAVRKIDLYRHVLIPKAQENIQVSLQGYQAGEARFLDLIDSARTQLELELILERAMADRGESLAELEKLAGRELAEEVNQ